MRIPASEISKRWTKGQGPGGTNRNKLETCCVLEHKSTGLMAIGDRRTRRESYAAAYDSLCQIVERHFEELRAERRKARRDAAIKDRNRVRTYDYTKGIVTDHRTGKRASIKNVVGKGRLELLR